jgi:thioredoxin reductase (NADPH)
VEKQMERIGVEATFDAVTTIQHDGSRFYVRAAQAEYHPHYVIVASGTKPKPISLNIPKKATDKVFSDVYHLRNETEKHVVIVGGGDAAFDYALNLVKKRNFVTILNRGGEVKCLGLLWERAVAEAAIEYRAETPVSAVEVDDNGNRLRVRTEAGKSIETDYLLFAIGRVPQTDFLPAELINQNVTGLYFVGDVQNGLFRQAAIAAGDGLRVAMDIYFKMNSEA